MIKKEISIKLMALVICMVSLGATQSNACDNEYDCLTDPKNAKYLQDISPNDTKGCVLQDKGRACKAF
jgi:hypothetical protein